MSISIKDETQRMEYVYHYASPLVGITLNSDGHALTGLMFDGEKSFGEKIKLLEPEGADMTRLFVPAGGTAL